MVKFDPFMESRIHEAILFKEKNPQLKLPFVAAKFKVHYHLLYARINGRRGANTNGGHNTVLTKGQDEALRQFINFLIGIGHQATKKHILLAVNSILRDDGSTRTVDAQWARR